MDRHWLANYPAGIPHDIDPDCYPSVTAIIEERLGKSSDEPAFTSFGVDASFARIEAQSRAFGAYCQERLGLKKGDRIAIMMPNLIQYPIVLFGALRAGLTVVNTNPLYTARELEHQLSDSGAKAIVVVENFASVLESCLSNTPVEHVIVTRMGDCLPGLKGSIVNAVVKYLKGMVPAYSLPEALRFKDAVSDGAACTLRPSDLGPDDIAFLQYTGGTTGVSKGAVLTHRNMVANVMQGYTWIKPHLLVGEDGESKDVVVTALPLYHIFALTANCLAFFMIGARNILIVNPRDLKTFIKTLKGAPFSVLTGVNTLFNALLNSPGFETIDFSSLRVTLGGGMAVQVATAKRWQAVTGCTLTEAYGLTETSPAVCINPLDLPEHNSCIGLPISSTECKVIDADGNQVAIGTEGELCVRGPQVMRGYWQREQETAEVLDGDGWLRTGDVAVIDPRGYIKLVDRKKDMILVSGFNVYPTEIEDVVALHDGVLEVGAIGVPDERSGEAVKIVVVKKDPGLTVEILEEHCAANLTNYKRPRYVEFATELPKTNVGKILRRELRESFGEARGS